MESTGVTATLHEDKNGTFLSSSYNEHFRYRSCPSSSQSTEQQRIQRLSVVMGDAKKRFEKETTYSSNFRQTGADSPEKLKELRPEIKKPQPLNLRVLANDEWSTTTSETFPKHSYGCVDLAHKDKNLSCVFKEKTLNQDKMMTTNQSCFLEINPTHFPVHVDGSSIVKSSHVQFGKPSLAGTFYVTTSKEEFPVKELVRTRPENHPPSRILFEQEPEPMLTTVQRDFVPMNCRRQQLSPWQLHLILDRSSLS